MFCSVAFIKPFQQMAELENHDCAPTGQTDQYTVAVRFGSSCSLGTGFDLILGSGRLYVIYIGQYKSGLAILFYLGDPQQLLGSQLAGFTPRSLRP